MSTSSFTAQHFFNWYHDAYGPYASFRSGTRGPTGGTTALSDKHPYRGLMWFDAAAITTALTGRRVTGIAVTFVSNNSSYETAGSVGVRLYKTDLTYNAGNDGYNSADTVRWTTGMTAANPTNAHMIEYGTTPGFLPGATLTAGSFASGDLAERFATALKAGYAIGSWELKPGSTMSESETYRVRVMNTAPVIIITHEAASTDCTPPTSAGLTAAYGKTTVPLAYAGATGGGSGHEIAGINYQYAESADGTTWGAWSAAATIAATLGDGTINVPVGAAGVYRKYQVAVKSADNSVTSYVAATGVALNPATPAAPTVSAVVSGRRVTWTVVCAADPYGQWTSLYRALDGAAATVLLSIPPAGGAFTLTETLTAALHSSVFRRWDLFGGYSSTVTVATTCTEASEAGKGWLKWNGQSSLDYGLIVLDQPEPTKPAERVTYETVLGRSGYVSVTEATDVYTTLEKTATLLISDGDSDKVRTWLKGPGTVQFGVEPDYLYSAYISSLVTFETIVRGRVQRRAAVTFSCQPAKTLADETAQTYTTSGAYLHNIGNVAAKPLITVYGSGDLTLTIGLQTMTMEGVSESVTLDCLEQVAVDEAGADYTALTGGFFLVPVGANQLTWTGGVTSVSVLPRWGFV